MKVVYPIIRYLLYQSIISLFLARQIPANQYRHLLLLLLLLLLFVLTNYSCVDITKYIIAYACILCPQL